MLVLFFLASRRGHTRLQGDWSSDVCSSDLALQVGRSRLGVAIRIELRGVRLAQEVVVVVELLGLAEYGREIGRASCRERGESGGGATREEETETEAETNWSEVDVT